MTHPSELDAEITAIRDEIQRTRFLEARLAELQAQRAALGEPDLSREVSTLIFQMAQRLKWDGWHYSTLKRDQGKELVAAALRRGMELALAPRSVVEALAEEATRKHCERGGTLNDFARLADCEALKLTRAPGVSWPGEDAHQLLKELAAEKYGGEVWARSDRLNKLAERARRILGSTS